MRRRSARADHEAVGIRRLVRCRCLPGFCPRDVGRPRAVTLLAGHRELGPRGGVAVRGEVVALLEIGRVALGALVVPRLLAARPVERVRRAQRHVGIEMKPSLPALRAGPRVPGQAERLEPAVGERDEVLLQGVDTERVRDLELARLAVRALGADEELAVPAEERGGDAPVRDAGLVEAPEDGLGCGGLHRARVVGAAKGVRFLRVAVIWCRRRRSAAWPGGLPGRSGLIGALAADPGPDRRASAPGSRGGSRRAPARTGSPQAVARPRDATLARPIRGGGRPERPRATPGARAIIERCAGCVSSTARTASTS